MEKRTLAVFLSESCIDKSYSSESSDWSDTQSITELSDDDDTSEDTLFFPLMQYLLRSKKKRVDDYLHCIESWTDVEFKNRLRLSRQTANRLIGDLEKSGFIATHKFGLKPLEPKLCFYIFLTFISSIESLTPIATRFDISISSTFRVIRRVVAWLLTKLNDTIKWPTEIENIKDISNTFYEKTGISNVIGVIDCLHVKIEKPKNAREYCNAKGYFSIVLQATVDANLRFTNIYCGEPGSSNCFRTLKKSPLYNTTLKDKNLLFPYNVYLIGHSGYPSLSWLVPPYRENKRLTLTQREFNSLHVSARKISEKAFALLKSRFKRIKLFGVYRNIAFITDTIVAACILHNYCVNENDQLEE
ncbi:unnamed protein product [Colias eurytheme]|nr:unnamed protein product [Colias eurytheme]